MRRATQAMLWGGAAVAVLALIEKARAEKLRTQAEIVDDARAALQELPSDYTAQQVGALDSELAELQRQVRRLPTRAETVLTVGAGAAFLGLYLSSSGSR